jgi:hypothetical protein
MEKKLLCHWASLQPMATVAYWAKAQLAGPWWWPLEWPRQRVHGQSAPSARSPRGVGPAHAVWRGAYQRIGG